MTTAYTADFLLEELRRAGSLPAAAATGTADSDLLAHADSELRDTLVPLMLSVREEFYERVFDTTVVSGTAAYRLNKRAALSRVNTVQWLGADGNLINLIRLEPKRAPELVNPSTTGTPWAYYLEGSRVVLFPTPSSGGTLRVRAFVRPGRLALLAASGSLAATVVTGAASTSFVLTITGHSYTTSTPVDVVSATPSFEYLALDATPTAASAGTTITLTGSGFSTDPAVGDYVVNPDTTPFVQLPVELHPALIELTVARYLRASGRLQEAAGHAEEAKRLVGIGIQALTPRVETAERKIVGGPQWRKRGFGLMRWGP